MYCRNWYHLYMYIIIYLLYSYVGLGLVLGIGLQLGLGIRLGLGLRLGIVLRLGLGIRLGLGLRPLPPPSPSPSPYYMSHKQTRDTSFHKGIATQICVKSVRRIPNFKGGVHFHDTGLISFNTKRYEKKS